MKKIYFIIPALLLFSNGRSQTLSYANFSVSLSQSVSVKVANNNSYNTALSTTTGNGVTWDASGLTAMAGYPTINLSFQNPNTTPYQSMYSSANYCEYDPALTANLPYNYYGISADSLTEWGSYEPSAQHEIFQDPDKHLIFPFNYGQSFTDNYAKTNYSDATTVSSYQTGSRTVTFCGFGTLILPQGSFSNVAMISELRTNSLGPDSYYYTWYDINTGKKLLYRSENDGSITTAWCIEAANSIQENNPIRYSISPNPTADFITISGSTSNEIFSSVSISDLSGKIVMQLSQLNSSEKINISSLLPGIYFLSIENNSSSVQTKPIIKL